MICEENEKDILDELRDGSKVLIVRDAVPIGEMGITLMLGKGEIGNYTLDIIEHRELLKTLVMAVTA